MWMTSSQLTRILICLAALTTPLQGMSASVCHCCSGHGLTATDCCTSQDNGTPCCCTDASHCQCSDIASDNEALSCCDDSQTGESIACGCGSDCHCGESHSTPIPLTPAPVQKSPTEQLTDFGQSVISSTLITQIRPKKPVSSIFVMERASDRCACLCCFTL